MKTHEVAKKLATQHNLKAERFDLFLREFDNTVELIGLVPDPNYDMKDFVGREMLFPKRWVTLKTFDAETAV
jgi:hypothetical protein